MRQQPSTAITEIVAAARANGGSIEQGKAAAEAVDGKLEKVVMIPSDRWQDTKVLDGENTLI